MAQLYAGLSFYYSDFLSLKECSYNNNLGYKNNFYGRIRVIEKNNLGVFITSTPFKDIKDALDLATLNSRVATVLPSDKIRVYYPYIHTFTKKTKDLNYKNIQKINYKLKTFENKYKPSFFDFTIKKNSKIIVSNIGSIIEQDFLTVKFNIKIKNRNYFEHYKINDIYDIKFPKINTIKLKSLDENYNLLLSPKVVSKIALFLFNNNLDFKALELSINPYLYKGVQANLYDDEGCFRINSKYKGLSGGNIFQNDNSSGYFYDFNSHEFIIKQPDLEIQKGDFKINSLKDKYLLANDFDTIKISNGKIVINCDLSLFGKEKNQGYMIKTINIPLGEFKKIKNFTTTKKVIGLEDSSVNAPYIYIGKNYE